MMLAHSLLAACFGTWGVLSADVSQIAYLSAIPVPELQLRDACMVDILSFCGEVAAEWRECQTEEPWTSQVIGVSKSVVLVRWMPRVFVQEESDSSMFVANLDSNYKDPGFFDLKFTGSRSDVSIFELLVEIERNTGSVLLLGQNWFVVGVSPVDLNRQVNNQRLMLFGDADGICIQAEMKDAE